MRSKRQTTNEQRVSKRQRTGDLQPWCDLLKQFQTFAPTDGARSLNKLLRTMDTMEPVSHPIVEYTRNFGGGLRYGMKSLAAFQKHGFLVFPCLFPCDAVLLGLRTKGLPSQLLPCDTWQHLAATTKSSVKGMVMAVFQAMTSPQDMLFSHTVAEMEEQAAAGHGDDEYVVKDLKEKEAARWCDMLLQQIPVTHDLPLLEFIGRALCVGNHEILQPIAKRLNNPCLLATAEWNDMDLPVAAVAYQPAFCSMLWRHIMQFGTPYDCVEHISLFGHILANMTQPKPATIAAAFRSLLRKGRRQEGGLHYYQECILFPLLDSLEEKVPLPPTLPYECDECGYEGETEQRIAVARLLPSGRFVSLSDSEYCSENERD